MKIKRLYALLATSLVFASPAHAIDATVGVSASEIKIGMVNAQSGPASALGTNIRLGAQAVFKDINEQGGVFGRKLVLYTADDAYEPEQTVNETLRLAQEENVFSFLGFVGTPTTNAVLPLIRELDIPVVGIVSGAQSMRYPVTRQVFNIRASYNDETEVLVDKFFETGPRSVGVVYQFDAFGRSVLTGVEQALAVRGATISNSASFKRNTVAIEAALGAMRQNPPDVIILAGTYEPVAAFVKAARAAGLKSRFATVSFVGTNSLLPLLQDAGNGMLISQVVPFPDDSDFAITRECRRLLITHENVSLNFANFEGCISARVLVDAIKVVGLDLNRPALLKVLEGIHRPATKPGAHVAFGPKSQQVSRHVYLTEVQSGRITPLR